MATARAPVCLIYRRKADIPEGDNIKRTFRIVPFAALFLAAACATSPYDTTTGSSFTSTSNARGVSTTEANAAATGSAASTGAQREPAGVMNNPK